MTDSSQSNASTVATQTVRTLQEMIALGRYDWVNNLIVEGNFPMPANLVLGAEPKPYHFDRDISSEDAIALMEKDGYRPAMIWDLLDFGSKNPEDQGKYPILALGSVAIIGAFRFVALLRRGGSERDLDLGWLDDVWGRGYHFLAVRK